MNNNVKISVFAGILGAAINYLQFGSFWSALLGAGPVSFVISLIFCYGVDWMRGK